MPIVVGVDDTGAAEAGSGFGPCAAWTARFCCDTSADEPDTVTQMTQAATEILHALSGRQFGLCELTLRPCRGTCADTLPWAPWPGIGWGLDAPVGGRWYSYGCGLCPGVCSCANLSEVVLPGLVRSVGSVKVDGVELDASAYRLDGSRRLVRVDGEVWPSCNNLNLADTEEGTWSVTASFGQDPPVLGELAVGELACELLRACRGEDCRLPANMSQLVRQGVTISMPDPSEAFKDGLVGLPMGDRFIRAFNPFGLPARSRVYSVDRPSARRTG